MGTDIFKLNPKSGKYELNGYIPSDNEVDKLTEQKIREIYSLEDELKLNRLANSGDKIEFNKYNAFVEQCRTEGRNEKQRNAARLSGLKDHILNPGDDEPVNVKVEE